MKVGDVLLTIDGLPVDDESALRFRLATRAVDDTVKVRALRKGGEETFVMKIAAPPESPPRDSTRLAGRQPLAGVTVANMSPALADELAIETAQSGVIVTDIPQGMFAAQFLKPRDFIVAVNGREIDSVATLRTMLGTPAERWSVTVRRNGDVRTFNFRG
jgi:serine protease Do